jgi:hypothetical protein
VKGYFQSEQILEFSAELSRLKRRRIGSANYLLREKEAGAMVYFFLKAHESQMLKKKKALIVISIVFFTRQKVLHFSKSFEGRINECHCTREMRVSLTVKKRKVGIH